MSIDKKKKKNSSIYSLKFLIKEFLENNVEMKWWINKRYLYIFLTWEKQNISSSLVFISTILVIINVFEIFAVFF